MSNEQKRSRQQHLSANTNMKAPVNAELELRPLEDHELEIVNGGWSGPGDETSKEPAHLE